VNEALAVSTVDLTGHFHGNLFEMIYNAGPMVQIVLVILLFFSVLSWAIILMKYKILRKTKKENRMFLDIYMKGSRFSDIFLESRKFRNSTIAEVFRSGYTEMGKTAKAAKEMAAADGGESLPPVELQGLDNVVRTLNRACDSESGRLEGSLGFLATTGSATPFIGLFGTVWGIMNAFRGIGAKGSATLAVVAPGISEALIATAAGLAAAIPAVIFYNYFINQVRTVGQETEHFASEFLNIVERSTMRSSGS
jgi:biopolymer transport protein TolQ